MSYTVASPGGRTRPGVVAAASYLLYLCAALQLVSAVLALLRIGPTQDLVREEFGDLPNAEATVTTTVITSIVAVAIAVALAVGAIVLAVLIGRGKNPARIVTWVLGGIAVLCYTCGLVSTAVQGALLDSLAAEGDARQVELQRRMLEVGPEWITAVSTVIQIVLLVAFVAIIILLALPASNEFFRKEQEVWVPPAWPADGPLPPPPAPGGPTTGL